ncbi:MAG: pyridoxal 5'-phosphate synthase glutaminase subunit PdxT [Bryobacterales bacterium]|nr:pyridoxal 5'-phosphate synthase glutaminase subunit PdxT [Bryobacteraceae bacterium]MDW8129618.1 pyridoxal 5'-phosphate synthase glutaminase subunit PdxT [Bryobacterales bacterium]
MRIVGVLALQGDFEAHARALEQVGARPVLVRKAAELDAAEALVIPGGESTTMLRLLEDEGLFEALRAFGRERPIFGTCAGAILLATEVTNPTQSSLGLMDIAVERNAYGRQIESRIVRLAPEPEFAREAGDGALEAVFIRAPIIRRTGPGVRVYARYLGDPVLVAHGRHMAATFHPELSSDRRVHRLFLERIEAGNARAG